MTPGAVIEHTQSRTRYLVTAVSEDVICYRGFRDDHLFGPARFIYSGALPTTFCVVPNLRGGVAKIYRHAPIIWDRRPEATETGAHLTVRTIPPLSPGEGGQP